MLTDDDRPLVGSDYPWFCDGCRLAVDSCASAVAEGPDQDDPEAACNLAYDLRLFCSADGSRCAHPPTAWVHQQLDRALRRGDAYRCPKCGECSALQWSVADELGLPMARALDDPMCPHCSGAHQVADSIWARPALTLAA